MAVDKSIVHAAGPDSSPLSYFWFALLSCGVIALVIFVGALSPNQVPGEQRQAANVTRSTNQPLTSNASDSEIAIQKTISDATVVLAVLALAQLIASIFMWVVTRQNANAATKSAEAAEAHLHAVDRPWVNQKVRILGPLSVAPNGDIKLPIQVAITNVGPSVALHVDVKICLMPSLFEKGDDHAIRNQVWQRMGEWLQGKRAKMGLTLFPGDPYGQRLKLSLTGETMNLTWTRYAPELLSRPLNERPMPLLIYGQITYAQNGVKAIRYTHFGWQVTQVQGDDLIDPFAVTTPAENLRLTISSIGLNDAK